MRNYFPDSPSPVTSRRLSRILTRERLIACFVVIAFLGLTLFLALRWFEQAVTFQPVRYEAQQGWKQPTEANDVWLTTSDGLKLHGWFFA
ncbi:MAG: hypothetical protein M3447_03395, partial [Acidobacteriota bacterium]|nr:hypothetical protein [Acidobacteriota bacterium]